MTMKKPFAVLGTTLGTAAIAIVVAAAPASAHVTVNPKTAEPSSYAKLTFRVPNEKSTATTTRVEIALPAEHPITSVSVQPHVGWAYEVQKTKLSTPVKVHGTDVTETASRVIWTSSGGEIKPGEFEEFNLSLGPLPKNEEKLTFPALQSYSDGDVVRWIEAPKADGSSPEHPAPVLTLTSAVPGSGSGTTASQDEVDTARALAIAGVVVGLLGVSLGAVALVLSRRHTNAG